LIPGIFDYFFESLFSLVSFSAAALGKQVVDLLGSESLRAIDYAELQ